MYWIDAGIGIAFEHVERLAALVAHLGDSMRIVEDVHAEWERKASNPPGAGTSLSADEALRMAHVCEVCRRLTSVALAICGQAHALSTSEGPAIDVLRRELALLPEAEAAPGPGDHWRHRGECASIRAAELNARDATAAGRSAPIQILATNDTKALKLAFNHGLAVRTSAELLREMVAAKHEGLTAPDAWELHLSMMEVASIAHARRPAAPSYFAVDDKTLTSGTQV